MSLGDAPSMASSCPNLRSTSPRRDPRAGLRALLAVAATVAAGAVALVSSNTGAYAALGGLPSPTLRPPIASFSAVRLFDRPATPWAAGHRGIDLRATEGDAIASPGEGEVTFAGTVVDRGVVTVDHGGGLVSSIEPIAATVAVGDHVDAGDSLGVVSGEPGHCFPRTCVHWGVRFQGEYVNPLDVLAGYGSIVLLP